MLLTMTACGGSTGDGVNLAASTPRIAVAPSPKAGEPQEQARFDGTFLIKDGCLLGKRTGSNELSLIVFPFGTTATDSAITAVDGKTVTFDRMASLGGGFRNVDRYKDALSACPATAVFVANEIL